MLSSTSINANKSSSSATNSNDSNDLNKLNRENALLKDQLQRTLKELKSYQLKYPLTSVDHASINSSTISDELPPWMLSPDIINPLLDSYDMRIRELEGIIINQNNQINQMYDNVDSLINENNQLRESQLENLRLNATTLSSFDATSGGNSSSSSGSNNIKSVLHSELVADLQERIELLMTENALLIDQKSVLLSELDKYQIELNDKVSETITLSLKITEISKELQLTISRRNQLEHERDEAAIQAVNYSDALGKAEAEIDDYQNQVNVARVTCEEAQAALHETVRQMKLLKDKSDEDSFSYIKRAKAAEDRVRELHLLLLQKTKELDSTQEVCRKLKREYQSTKQDAEGMLQVMSGLEKQLAEYSNRSNEVEMIAKISKEKVEEALIEKEKAVIMEKKSQLDIERYLEERLVLLKNNQVDVDAAVSKATLKSNQKIESYEKDLQDLAQRVAAVRYESDRSVKDSKIAKGNYDRLLVVHDEERRSVEGIVKEIGDKLQATIIIKEEEVSRRVELQEMAKELRLTVDRLRSDADEYQVQLTQVNRYKDNEINTLKATIREIQRENFDKTRKLTMKSKELDECRTHIDTNVASIEKRYHDENELLKRRCYEAEKLTKELEDINNVNEQKVEIIIKQIKLTSEVTSKQLEGRLNDEINLKLQYIQHNKELSDTIDSISEEKDLLINVIEDAKKTINQLQCDLDDSKRLVSDLSEQLTHSYEKREIDTDTTYKATEESYKATAAINHTIPPTSTGTCTDRVDNVQSFPIAQGEEGSDSDISIEGNENDSISGNESVNYDDDEF